MFVHNDILKKCHCALNSSFSFVKIMDKGEKKVNIDYPTRGTQITTNSIH
jgi:hypothetical protein